jgi:ABC-2 type transport system ATP-binding protein
MISIGTSWSCSNPSAQSPIMNPNMLNVTAVRTRITIILTTHYLQEAEEMADRIGVILRGELILVEDKNRLMRKLGKKQLRLKLLEPLATLPDGLADWRVELSVDGCELVYTFDTTAEHTGVTSLLRRLADLGLRFSDLDTRESSLEDIFVSLVRERA